jgi:transcriptional regulator with XRE-family HTH domain
MSFFGKNIKKIRGVKGWSQQVFAEIFELKRATLGAYEEGRSQPKIETIIKIANYFSISIDDLLTSEITVNTLLQFQDDFVLKAENKEQEILKKIPLITPNNNKDYVLYYNKENFIADLPCMLLPFSSEEKWRGFIVDNLEMSSQDKGLYPKDVVTGKHVSLEKITSVEEGSLVLVLVGDELILRHFYHENENIILKAAHKNIEDKKYAVSEIKELWLVCYTFMKRLPNFENTMEDKLIFLEREFQRWKNKTS